MRLAKPDQNPGQIEVKDKRLHPVESVGQQSKKVHILLAEDDLMNQEIVFEILTKEAGIAVDIAQDGLEAVNLASEHPYDLILMDMRMPIMDGLETTRQIRLLKEHKNTPILAMTANAFSEDKQRCMEAGMSDFISKPFLPDTLFTTLFKWIDRAN